MWFLYIYAYDICVYIILVSLNGYEDNGLMALCIMDIHPYLSIYSFKGFTWHDVLGWIQSSDQVS